MKRIKFVLISAVVTLFMATSCEDAYNIIQDGELNENSLKTVDDLQSYLNGAVYGSLSISNEIAFSAIFTDEVGIGKGNGGQGLTLHRFFLNSDDGYAAGMWYGYYQTINRVNRTLRIANRIGVPTDPDELAQYNTILAEARALRAFSYLQMTAHFSPNLSDDSALGVMFIGDDVPGVNDFYPRVSNGIVYNAIEADLNYAYDNVSTANDYKHVTQNMINAMRARFYLYRGNYALAKQYAEAAIASAPALTLPTPVPANAPTNPSINATSAWNNSFYGTSSTNPYRRMWADVNQGEAIFALDRPASGSWENVAANFTTNTTSVSGSPLFEVSRALFNEFRTVPGDVRRYANIDPTSLINQNYDQDGVDYIATDVLVIDKYPGKTGFPLRNDVKVFRTSEMYLILAECLAHDGNLNGATNSVASVIKRIRDVRNFLGAQALPNYADATAAYADIMLERRKELCFEGHRYVDIKRLGALAGKTVDRHFTDDQITGVPLSIPNDDYRFAMPIPRQELNANGLMVQNPNY